MHYRLRTLSFAIATLLLSLTFPVLPFASTLSPLVAQAQTTQEREAEAERLYQQGVQQFEQGQFRDALQTFQQVLDISSRADIFEKIAHIFTKNKQYNHALIFLSRALKIRQENNDASAEAETIHSIGHLYLLSGKTQKSLDFYHHALAIYRQLDNRYAQENLRQDIVRAYRYMGKFYYQIQEYSDALKSYQKALEISEEINSDSFSLITVYILNDIGKTYLALNKNSQALESFEKALNKISRYRGSFSKIILDATLVQSLNSYVSNSVSHLDAPETSETAKGNALINRGDVYHKLGRNEQALESYQQALEIFRKINDMKSEEEILRRIKGIQN